MKELYFLYNPYSERYIFYESKKQHNRKEFSKDKNLIAILKKLPIDLKRKSFLHLDDLKEEDLGKIKEYFKNTKIIIR